MADRIRIAVLAGAMCFAGLSGCHRGQDRASRDPGLLADRRSFAVASRLDCPASQGALTLVEAAADGRSCRYRAGDDQETTLSILPLDGASPSAALAPIEATLRTQVGEASAAKALAPVVRSDGDQDHDHAKIDLPGLHIDANGDQAKIRLPGLSINADGDDAHVQTGWGGHGNTTVEAHKGGAVIRAGEVNRRNADLMLILASDVAGPSGYRAVGYIARGPASGPLVLAVFKSKTQRHGDVVMHDDVGRLIARNLRG